MQEHVAIVKGEKSAAGEGKKAPPSIPHQHLSCVDHSHRGPVQALQWLPGSNITKEGAHPPTVRGSSPPCFPCLHFSAEMQQSCSDTAQHILTLSQLQECRISAACHMLHVLTG